MRETVSMNNITVYVDDRTYHRARIGAAEMHTSVSAFVRESLMEITSEEMEFEQAVRKECELVDRIHTVGDAIPRLPV